MSFMLLFYTTCLMVVAPIPLVPMLPDEGGVVAGVDVAYVVDDREQRVHVVAQGRLVRPCEMKIMILT